MGKKKIRIRENSWLARLAARKLKFDYIAMVFGDTIHLYNTSIEAFFARPSWVVHELKHVQQYQEMGTVRFLWKYAVESWKHGYWNNGLEVEAREAEGDFSLLHRYDLTAYDRYKKIS